MIEGKSVDPSAWFLVTGILAAVSVGLATLLIMERERRKAQSQHTPPLITASPTIKRTVSPEMYEEARKKIRVLDIEREILGYAIRRLYEAHAEGKITEEERDRLAEKYRVELERIKEEIARGESIVALNELERMQEEIIKIFSERFDQITRRIEELRAISGFTPIEKEKEPEVDKEKTPKEKTVKKPTPKSKVRKARVKPPPEPERSDVEKRVEQIVSEVEKVLKRLGQMEVEE